MKKQVVFLLVFFILALGISLGVFFAARRRQLAYDRVRAWEKAHPDRTVVPPGLSSQGLRPGEAPSHPVGAPRNPTEDVQRTLKTIQDVQRINRMNDDLRRRQQQPSPQPPQQPPKK